MGRESKKDGFFRTSKLILFISFIGCCIFGQSRQNTSTHKRNISRKERYLNRCKNWSNSYNIRNNIFFGQWRAYFISWLNIQRSFWGDHYFERWAWKYLQKKKFLAWFILDWSCIPRTSRISLLQKK